MNKNNNNKCLIISLIVIITILLTIVILMFTGVINLNSNFTDNCNNKLNNNILNNNEVNLNNNLENIVNEITEKAFGYMHSMGPYCGVRNNEDTIKVDYSVWEASQFSSKNALNDYLKTFMTDSIINKYSRDKYYSVDIYKEQNGKLYCLNPQKDCGTYYNKEKTYYRLISATENSIVYGGTIAFDSCGGTDYITVQAELIKDSNNNWVVSSYLEIPTGVEIVSTVEEKLLGDIIDYNKLNSNHTISVVYNGDIFKSENEILSLKNKIIAPFESPNGAKWIEIKVSYDKSGYITNVIIN